MRIKYYDVAPEAMTALKQTFTYIESASIDARLRALIELRVSQINNCAYCLDLHARQARQAGEDQQRLDVLAAWRETSFFTEREQAALAWAESVTLVHETKVPDSVYEDARRHFSEKELVDLTLIIGMMNLLNRLGVSFRHSPRDRREGR